MNHNIKQQRRQIYAEINALQDRSASGEDVTAELREAGKRLDNLGKSKHRVDVMDMEKLTPEKPAKLTAAEKIARREDELVSKMQRAERRKWTRIAEGNGIKYKTFCARVDKGWTYKDAATIPSRNNPWTSVAKANGLNIHTYYHRRKMCWTDEEAATIPVNMHRKTYYEKVVRK